MSSATSMKEELEALKEELEALEKEAVRLHREAKEHNLAGRFQEAKDVYLRMYALEDQSLALASKLMPSVERQVAPPEYQVTHRPPTTGWASPECRRRARGAVLGYVVADAAAMGVHWVYDLQVLEELDRSRGSKGQLDFYDPPQSPYFTYASGRASPYGEQARCLLSCLVAEGGFNAMAYAQALASMYGEGWDGYRDASIKGFLRHWYRGRSPPDCGADDCQANCFIRLAPIVALYGGSGQPQDSLAMMRVVEYATRVTQNHDTAVAWGMGVSRLLELVVMGQGVAEATRQTVRELRDEGSVLGGYVSGVGDDGDGLREEVAYYLGQGVESAADGQTVAQAAARFGRNCHLPGCVQTPVQAAARLSVGGHGEGEGGPGGGAAEFVETVRAAIREGGCCASRAGLVGALLGAAMGGAEHDHHMLLLPEEWISKVTGWEQVQGWTDALLKLRD